MGFFPFKPLSGGGLALQAATPAAGYTLTAGGGTVISWTVPADGNNHQMFFICHLHITTLESGGAINVGYTTPDGAVLSNTLAAGNQGVGGKLQTSSAVVQSGSTVTVSQAALASGAAVMWAEIWGN